MPITYSIRPSLDLVVTRFTGRPEDDEFVRLYETLLHDDDYELGMNELADLRAVEGLDMTAEGLRRVDALFRERYADFEEDIRTAIVTQRDQPYGVARMYEAFSDAGPEKVKVCRNVEEAAAWLGIEVERLKEVT